MRRTKYPISFLVLLLTYAAVAGAEELTKDEIVDRVLAVATENEQAMNYLGFDANMIVRWLDGDGEIKKTELREYKTLWDTDPPHMELAYVDHREPDPKQREQEQKTAAEFQKTMGETSSNGNCRLPFTWRQLRERYNFDIDGHDSSATYVLKFSPKSNDLPERSRLEKVLNHLSGKIWVDDHFRIVRLDGHLSSRVSFGFGLAKVKELNLTYVQKPYGEQMIPNWLKLNLRIQALFFYSDRREITTSFGNFHTKDPEYARKLQQAPPTEPVQEAADTEIPNHHP